MKMIVHPCITLCSSCSMVIRSFHRIRHHTDEKINVVFYATFMIYDVGFAFHKFFFCNFDSPVLSEKLWKFVLVLIYKLDLFSSIFAVGSKHSYPHIVFSSNILNFYLSHKLINQFSLAKFEHSGESVKTNNTTQHSFCNCNNRFQK